MLHYQTIANPALALSPRESEDLCGKLLELNLRLSETEAFQANWRARIGTLLEDTSVIDLVWSDAQRTTLVGHLSERHMTLKGLQTVYIDTLTVDPELQRGEVGRTLARRSVVRANLMWRGRPVLHASRTSNPHVAAGVWRAFEDGRWYYPSFDPRRPSSPYLVEAAEVLSATRWPGVAFDPETGVLADAYSGRFITHRPSRHADVQRHFDAHTDPERGDAIVQIVGYQPGAWLRLVKYFLTHAMGQTRRQDPPRR